jgi:hypothetical protein
LCFLGCAIFGVTEVPTDGIDFESSEFAYTNLGNGSAAVAKPTPTSTVPPSSNNSDRTNGSSAPNVEQPLRTQSQPTEHVESNKKISVTTAEAGTLSSTTPESVTLPQHDLHGNKGTVSDASLSEKAVSGSAQSHTQSLRFESVLQEKMNSQVAPPNLGISSIPSDSQGDSSIDELLQVHDLD